MKKILDWNKYVSVARKVVAEGCVMLENKNNTLPLKKGTKLAVFGRIQHNYYKSGTGSGGMVNVTEVIGILEGLKKSSSIFIDETLEKIYLDWEKENPFEVGIGWGQEPWCQHEMPVSLELAKECASRNDVALIIIGRTAGEDKDNIETQGSWFLTDNETQMIENVSSTFKRTVVVLNTGNIIDMNFVSKYNIDSVVYVWQGGMIGGLGISDILTGKISPSGKLTDTIAKSIGDYPSSANFGNLKDNIYKEDIYVGYRYFETAAKDKVLYPFGFGLSYTNFEITSGDFEYDNGKILPSFKFDIKVKNTGNACAKEVVQIYVKQPQGKLGKPELVLADFKKTSNLKKGKSQKLSFNFDLSRIRSFDDTGITGNKNCFVCEKGIYEIYAGNSIRNIFKVADFSLDETIIIEKVCDALRPVVDFERFKSNLNESTKTIHFETEKVQAVLPYQNKHRNENLSEVEHFLDNKNLDQSILSLIENLSDEELSCIVRGEGMGSPKVTPGTASAFGGISSSLLKKGISCGCCTDGPSGIRLDSGAQAFSLPNGTSQACTFNLDLVEELYTFTGWEMVYNKVDILLGPGTNIHRHPLNGRNFEYFSEDPLVSGFFASAVIKGLANAGVTGSLKHFCCNNQEAGRWVSNSIVSTRALREIYLLPFEIAVKNGANVIMTSYGSVNSMWTSGNYDLVTMILRNDWGFKGIVITDWWAVSNCEGKEPERFNIAQNVRAQNDLFMVVPDASNNSHNDNILSSLASGELTRNELLRCAYNIVSFLQKSHAQLRFENKDIKVVIKHRKETSMDSYANDLVYFNVEDGLSIPLDDVDTTRGRSHGFGLICKDKNLYRLELLGMTGTHDLAQINVSVSYNGVHITTLGWNATHGQYEAKGISMDRPLSHYVVVNLYFAQSGLKLKEFRITKIKDGE